MRVSRHCYDKPHRCPGWAGGGTRRAKVGRCDGGRLQDPDHFGSWKSRWRFHRCDQCDVLALPIVVQWLDPAWVRWQLHFWREDRRYWK